MLFATQPDIQAPLDYSSVGSSPYASSSRLQEPLDVDQLSQKPSMDRTSQAGYPEEESNTHRILIPEDPTADECLQPQSYK